MADDNALADEDHVTHTVHSRQLASKSPAILTGAILKGALKHDPVLSVVIDPRLPDRRAFYRQRNEHHRMQWKVGDLRQLSWKGPSYDAIPDPSAADGLIGQCPSAHGAIIGTLDDSQGRQLLVDLSNFIEARQVPITSEPDSGQAPRASRFSQAIDSLHALITRVR